MTVEHYKVKYSNIKFQNYCSYKNQYDTKVFVKNVPDSLMGIFQCVCYNFNELRDEDIILEFKKINTTMQARPTKLFGERKYSIIINSNRKFDGIQFADIPHEARIGIIAHEMSHITDYYHKSNYEVLSTGLQFLTKKGKRQYERHIDKVTIEKGFGKELKAWAQYAMHDSKATDQYKKFKKNNYLHPTEIDSLLILTR